ncbi:MAG: DUF364 domain-containing protein [Spongiibacteraceae bacterium]
MSEKLYDFLIEQALARASNIQFKRVLLGLNWSVAETSVGGVGLCFSPTEVLRTLNWSGTLAEKPIVEFIDWIKSWNPVEAAVGALAINSLINHNSPVLSSSETLHGDTPANLRVFGCFQEKIIGQRVAVIGRYPGLDQLWRDVDYHCIERRPQGNDLPDTAAEYLLPQCDWVFITASSIANKTLPRLLELSQHAQVVLMGPSLPWLHEWADFGVNYLCGVEVCDRKRLFAIAGEGGGTKIFDASVKYHLLML